MANEKRLIDANACESEIRKMFRPYGDGTYPGDDAAMIHNETLVDVLETINEAATVDAVELPCKIGDFVWAIRSFNGHKHPQRGIVSDMFFTKDMKLMIVVKYVARGEWGKTVFATDKDACAAIGVSTCPNCGAYM